MHSPCFSFNIRIYGLLINHNQEVLLTDEFRMGTYMTKFPGGGLEYGEGTIDCLKREFKEELNINISIERHFYTTDYFQPAYFYDKMQMMSIYYLVNCDNLDSISISHTPNDIPPIEGQQAFRWVKIETLNPEDLTLPIDKKVVEMLKKA